MARSQNQSLNREQADTMNPGPTAAVHKKYPPVPVLISAIIIAAFLIMALGADVIAPHDPTETNIRMRLKGPSLDYPLGTDALGRCLASRIIYGSRTSIGLGVLIMTISGIVGVLIGLISGLGGRLVDELMMRITDMFLSFPEIIAALAIAGILGPKTINLVFALVMVSWMRFSRMVRGITLSEKERDFIQAARLSGVSQWGIIRHHILPACLPAIMVLGSLGLSKSILGISSLGFLGFGIQPPLPEWGCLLMEGKAYIRTAPYLAIFPGLAIILLVLSLNLVGDHLQDRLSERYQSKEV